MATKQTRRAATRSQPGPAKTKTVAPAKPAVKAKTSARAVGKRRSGGKKMKAYASFDLYFADRTPFHRRLIAALRTFVAREAPQLVESVKWGNGCWLQGHAPVAYVYADTDHVQFGFFAGAFLADPLRLLQGKGQHVRHVKVRALADIDEAAFGALLRQAAR